MTNIPSSSNFRESYKIPLSFLAGDKEIKILNN